MAGFNAFTNSAVSQIARYVFIGVASNLAGYIVYLLLTSWIVGPKLAMTLVYVTAATVGFFGNKQWTFRHEGKWISAALKYCLAHCMGYLLNLALLISFVDYLHYPHQLIQAIAIIIVAGVLFITFKFVVFKNAVDAAS